MQLDAIMKYMCKSVDYGLNGNTVYKRFSSCYIYAAAATVQGELSGQYVVLNFILQFA